MQKKLFILSGALATTLAFAACQPNQAGLTEDSSLTMASPTDATPTDTNTMASGSPAVDTTGGVMVGGSIMLPSRTIPENAGGAANLTTAVSALKQAELVETLLGPGPYTVFAPTNDAFEKLPAGDLQKMMEPAQKEQLKKVLTYHVVAGSYDSSKLTDGLKLKTVQGEQLTVMVKDGKISIKDAKGNIANVETADVMQSNGIVHVIDSVLIP